MNIKSTPIICSIMNFAGLLSLVFVRMRNLKETKMKISFFVAGVGILLGANVANPAHAATTLVASGGFTVMSLMGGAYVTSEGAIEDTRSKWKLGCCF